MGPGVESEGECEVEVSALAAGGDGVARLPDGRVLFLPFTAPGDRVRARIEESHKRFARGRVEAILSPSLDRVEAPCAHFGHCGGCSWQHLRYEAQLRAKQEIVRDALSRIGGVASDPLSPITASPEPYGYRTRARLLRGRQGVGYRARRSRKLCPIDACPVLAPELAAGLGKARSLAHRGEFELLLGADGAVRAEPLPPTGPGERVTLPLVSARIQVSPGVFAQANGLLLDALARAVVSAASESPPGAGALELYAGAGLFTLGLAEHFTALRAVEVSPVATADLAHNLESAGRTNVEVVTAPVDRYLSGHLADTSLPRPGVVVLDPPRGGLEGKAARNLAALQAERIIYLSCDPATLARDLGILSSTYEVTTTRLFDLFPQTPHIETLVALTASSPR